MLRVYSLVRFVIPVILINARLLSSLLLQRRLLRPLRRQDPSPPLLRNRPALPLHCLPAAWS
jgi:hypothetical protein